MTSDTFDRSYDGERDAAMRKFETDAVSMAAAGWHPVSQHFQPAALSRRRRLILITLALANIDLWPAETLLVTYRRTGNLEVGPQRMAAATEADRATAPSASAAPSTIRRGRASKARWLASVLIGVAVFVAVAMVAAVFLEGPSPVYVEGRPPVSALIGLLAGVLVAGRVSGADSLTAWITVGIGVLVGLFAISWVVFAVVAATSPPGG